MPEEPEFHCGSTVRIAVDATSWIPKNLQGKTVKILRRDPYDDVRRTYIYHVRVGDTPEAEAVREDWIERVIL